MTKTCYHCEKQYAGDNTPAPHYCSEACAKAAWRAEQVEEIWAGSPHKPLRRYRTPIPELVEQNPEAWAVARTYGRPWRNLYLHGPEGVGKTALCKFLLARVIEYGHRIEVPTMVWLQSISTSYEMEKATRRLFTAPLLLLDDVHDVCLDRRGYALIRTLIEARTDDRKRTLVTTNLTPKHLAEHIDITCGEGYGLQLLRRLSPVQNIEMTGASYRSTINQQLKEEMQ